MASGGVIETDTPPFLTDGGTRRWVRNWMAAARPFPPKTGNGETRCAATSRPVQWRRGTVTRLRFAHWTQPNNWLQRATVSAPLRRHFNNLRSPHAKLLASAAQSCQRRNRPPCACVAFVRAQV